MSRYEAIGGLSPLPDITRRQASALGQALEAASPGTHRTHVGMKHWHPFVREAVDDIVAQGADEVIGLVLAPHYSKMSIGGYQQRLPAAPAAAAASPGGDTRPPWDECP